MKNGAIVVGAGPVGLMLAGELRLGGVDVVVYEKLLAPTEESRGASITRRTAELFDQRGLLSRLGETEPAESHFGGVRIDLSMLEENHYSARGVSQARTENMLADWLAELGVPVRRGYEAVGFHETADGVMVSFDGPDGRHQDIAEYLVGCDGSRSVVRQLAGVDFSGPEPTRGMYAVDVTGIETRRRRIAQLIPGGSMVMVMDLDNNVTRLVLHEVGTPPRAKDSLTFTEVADSWQRLTGESIHHAQVQWLSTFSDATRVAAEYRRGRVILAGDATHVQPPAMAMGLSVGVQDAVNLGWKLAAVIKGTAPDSLLDSYHSERHPIGEQLIRNVQASLTLALTGDELDPLRSVMRELVSYKDAAAHLVGMVSGLSIRYDMGAGEHPLLGLRMPPDRELALTDGTRTRVAELLHPARGVFITASDDSEARRLITGWADRVDIVNGNWVPAQPPGLPAALDEVLIRPDGYIAWAAPGGADLSGALGRWFGSARVVTPTVATSSRGQ
jgi:2-polyprenyl-6-methoxyphenol hydroxylase-like FAD-dependent oxidoreductase